MPNTSSKSSEYLYHNPQSVVISQIKASKYNTMSSNVPSMAPLRVSPLIKFSRWSLLLLGIWYGSTRWNYLHRKEEKYRDYLKEMKPTWDAEKAAKKKAADDAQAADLKAQGIDLGGSS